MRVLPASDIPEEIWTNNTLSITNELTAAYRDELQNHGVLNEAISGTTKKDIYGGITDQETIEHFTYRFATSGGRVEFVSLAPDEIMSEISDAILSTFSQGEVAVLDIPCGTGSAMCSLLTTIAFLRSKSVLPTLPLTVRIMGGDLAPKALEVYASMLNRIRPYLSENSISISYESMIWDATRGDHTAALIDAWFELANERAEYVVSVTNFTGALIGAGIFDDFSPCLNQILSRLHNKKSTLLWVEPNSNATEKLTKKLMNLIKNTINWFTKTGEEEKFFRSNYEMINPLNSNKFKTGDRKSVV